jgi:hypothetical protein
MEVSGAVGLQHHRSPVGAAANAWDGPPVPCPSTQAPSEAYIRRLIQEELHLQLFETCQDKSKPFGELRLLFKDVKQERTVTEERRRQGLDQIQLVQQTFPAIQSLIDCAKPLSAVAARAGSKDLLGKKPTGLVASLFGGLKRSAVVPKASEIEAERPDASCPNVYEQFKCLQEAKCSFLDAKREVERLVWKGQPFDQLDEKVALREEARRNYINAISYAMEDILRMTGCPDKSSLENHIGNTRQARNDLVKCIEHVKAAVASSALFLDAATVTVPIDSEGPGAYESVANAWQHYREQCDQKSSKIPQASQQSLEAITKMESMKMKLLFVVEPSKLQTCFDWAHSQSSRGDESQLLEQLKKASQLLAEEKVFWEGFDAIDKLPLGAISSFSQQECERRTRYLDNLADANVAYDLLEAEHQHHSDSLPEQSELKKNKVLTMFQGKAQQRENSLIDVDVAALQLKKERIGAVPTKLPAFVKKLEDTKKKAKQAGHELEGAMNELFQLAQIFPEITTRVRYEKSMESAIPPELRPLWKAMRTLEEFEDYKELTTDSRHTVYKVKEGDEHFALKAYSIGESTSSSHRDVLRTCLREASLLFRLQHPNIVKVSAIFASPGRLCIQMPFYENSSLDVWVAAKHPTQPTVRRACGQALLALNHCHVMRVVHADVKPANILVDTLNNAALADFDISFDTATRCSSVRMTQLFIGGTAGYLAPEVQNDGQPASFKSDMFAFGRTLLTVQALETGHALASRLLHTNPDQRPSAGEVLAHPVIREAFDSTPEYTCKCSGGCMDYKNSGVGVVCPASHFICQECLDQWVRAELDLIVASSDYLAKHRQRRGLIVCPQCKSMDIDEGLLDDQEVTKFVDPSTYKQYRDARDASTEQRVFEERKAEFDDQVAALERRYASLHAGQVRQQQEAINEAATREFLKRNFPNAKQCPECGYGPVINENCRNLATHDGQAVAGGRISNRCPRCNYFDRDWNNWAPWRP